MKKMLVLTLAMVALANVAHAAPGERDNKTAADRARDAIKAAAHGKEAGHVSPEAGRIGTLVEGSRFGNELSGAQMHDLKAALGDESIQTAAKEIAGSKHASTSTLGKLDSARMEGLANLNKIHADVRNLTKPVALPEEKAQQAYTALVLAAGKQAAGWPETTQKNMVQFLGKANELLQSGRSFDQALQGAKEDLKATAKVDINIEKIKELCKIG